MTNNDPLQTLVSDDAQAIDRKKMAEVLRSFVLIDRASKQIVLLPDFKKVGLNTEKIEIILLASKARSLIFKTKDGLTPSEIIALGAMPEGSVKATIKMLFDSKKIEKDGEKRYFLPGYRRNELINQYNKK